MITAFALNATLLFVIPQPGGLPIDHKTGAWGTFRTEQGCMSAYYDEIIHMQRTYKAVHVRTIPDAPCKRTLLPPSESKYITD